MDTSPPLSSEPTVGLVILTTGDRPADLESIMRSASPLPFHERLIVGNGSAPPEMDGWLRVHSPTNLGVPGGRSLGMEHTTTDVVVFLDDDSRLRDTDANANTDGNVVDQVQAVFGADSTIGALALRVVVTGTDETLRRWSPRPTKGPAADLVDVPTFPGNGHALRRQAFNDVGGYLDELFFKHEETELSWRLIDAGWRVVTEPSIVVEHPNTAESRHEMAIEFGLRNKLWISRLRLPAPVAVVSSVISTGRSIARCRSTADITAVSRGLRAGTSALPEQRDPISWATVIKLTKAGRPPIF